MASVDGSRTLQGASDEFHINICGACKTMDVERGASHYCKDCPVYLCDQCKDHHRKLPLTKNHRIVSESQVPVVTSTRGRPATVIYCSCYKNEEVQYFCDGHQDAVCASCKNTKHYRCKVSRIQDKSKGYTKSKIDVIMSKIKAIEDDYAQLKTSRNDQSKSLMHTKEHCIKEINACRKELNTFLDDLEKSMLKLLDYKADEGQKRLSQHISSLTETLKMLKTDSKLLQDAKSNGGPALMFAADFQVSKGLQEYEERLSDMVNDVIDTDIKFELNSKLANLQTEIDTLGSLIRRSARNIQIGRKMLLDSTIQSQKQVNVKLSDDSSQPSITGSVVMPTGDIVLCDRNNRKLKLLDSSDILKDSMKLKAPPLGYLRR